jgi:hypothetical protein
MYHELVIHCRLTINIGNIVGLNDSLMHNRRKTTFIKLCKYLKKHPNDRPDTYEIKTVMVGNTGVGKTNMHVRYMNQCYLADIDTNK